MATISKLHAESYSGSAAGRAREKVKRAQQSLVVDTHFHIVTSMAESDAVTEKMVNDQVSLSSPLSLL